MEIRSPYSARTARWDRLPRRRSAARRMAARDASMAGSAAKCRHRGPSGSVPAASSAGRGAVSR